MSIIQGAAVRAAEYSSVQKFQQAVIESNSAVESSGIRNGDSQVKQIPSMEKQLTLFDLSKLNEEEKEKLEAALEKLNASIATSAGKILKFKYDEKAEKSYVEVVDVASQKVVASLPPEFLIDLSIKMKEIIGMFIDKKL